MVYPIFNTIINEVSKVNLHSAKVLQPKFIAYEKVKWIISNSETVGPSHDVSSIETPKIGLP